MEKARQKNTHDRKIFIEISHNECMFYSNISEPKFTSVSKIHISSLQLLSCVRLSVTPWAAARQASLSITNSRSLLKLMATELVMPTNHLILCRPQFFSSGGSSSHQLQSIGASALTSGLPCVQGLIFKGLSSLSQHHSSKASVLRRSFPYGPTHTCGEIIIEIKKMISAKFRLPLVGKERAGPWWGRQVCHRDDRG